MSRQIKRALAVVISVLMLLLMLAGCGGNRTTAKEASTGTVAASTAVSSEAKAPEMQTLELTMFNQWNQPFVDPAEDVVAPAIEAKGWKINVKEHLYESGQNWSDKISLFIASGTLPDVFEFPASGVDTAAKYADQFVDFTSILTDSSKIPNLSKYLTPKTINLMKTQESKKEDKPVLWRGLRTVRFKPSWFRHHSSYYNTMLRQRREYCFMTTEKIIKLHRIFFSYRIYL